MADFNLGDIDLGSGADIDGYLSSPADEQGGIYTTSSILQSLLPKTSYTEFEVGGAQGIQSQGSPGIDAMFNTGRAHAPPGLPKNALDYLYGTPPGYQPPASKRLVGAVGDLKNFTRVASETLVHKSSNDLWSLRKEADGKFYIERLFDDNGEPLKG